MIAVVIEGRGCRQKRKRLGQVVWEMEIGEEIMVVVVLKWCDRGSKVLEE